MKTAPIPSYEDARLCVIEDMGVIGTDDARFARVTKAAIDRFCVPISTVSIIDADREWFASAQGISKTEDARATSFCGHALLSPVMLVIEDTLKDERFKDNPHVTATPSVRFYAGKSLYERTRNLPVGVFCIKDYGPRVMSTKDIADFLALAMAAEDLLNTLYPARPRV